MREIGREPRGRRPLRGADVRRRSLLLTNLTGHPCVVVPNGFRMTDGTPTSITFTGKLRGENDLLAVADLFQRATDFHTRRPKLPEGPAAKG